MISKLKVESYSRIAGYLLLSVCLVLAVSCSGRSRPKVGKGKELATAVRTQSGVFGVTCVECVASGRSFPGIMIIFRENGPVYELRDDTFVLESRESGIRLTVPMGKAILYDEIHGSFKEVAAKWDIRLMSDEASLRAFVTKACSMVQ